MTMYGTRIRVTGLWGLLIVLAASGCSQLIDPDVPAPLRPCVEPQHGRDYLLYRPSGYDQAFAWPLVVVCHSSPMDSPNRQIRNWTELAESRGFLVVAPKLRGIKGKFPPKAAKQLVRQRNDEEHILSTVRHVRAGHNISADRVFIHGWSGGALAALHTGLKHPRVFRAVSAIAPKFNSGFLTDVKDRIDPYQPIYVNCGVADVIKGRHGRDCIEWLRSKGANLDENPMGSAKAEDTQHVIEFYEEVTRHNAWIHIRAFPADPSNAMAMRFKLQSSYVPNRYRWEFGDGDESSVAEPIHIYATAGTYPITVTTDGPRDRHDIRKIRLKVPQATIKQAGE